ncbi:ABC transporter substrate-binding protein [Catellatospora aurea]|uniref:ABC transporter substrate-binding protein n=1 Tax=Catellatospora aurea TaxID=1337874 RepID=A0ABW2HA24_9ACTN
MRITTVFAVGTLLAVSACGGPSGGDGAGEPNGGSGITQQTVTMDPTAKGPAAEVPGAKKGGVITVYSQSTPNTFDPTDIYFVDTNEIGRLLFRTPTQYAIRSGKAVLVPDLTDLGTVSADKLSWTFKMKTGIKYADGSEVKVEDLAYAVKRLFAHDIYKNSPTYQFTYFKDGDKYKGPYASGDQYSGVETPDATTLVIHLARPFSDLPYFMSFPAFTPIPKAKDTKENYKNNPLATGPYQFSAYTPGSSLKLKRNEHWDAASDPVRHQYVDGWDFQWGGEDVKTQQQVLNSSGPDANALNYANVDATLIPQLMQKKTQLLQGESPCTIVTQMDTRKIPLEVRKAIAKAFPYDQLYKAAGLNDLVADTASTIMPPSVAGYTKYTPHPDLDGTGNGDPAEAKKMLEAAGKVGFELSWYYDNTSPLAQQVNQIRTDALTAAGFTVKAIGTATAELRGKVSDYDAPVNMGQSPNGWCSDWPTGGSWFPVLFRSQSIDEGTSWGMLKDSTLDAEIDAVSNLPVDASTAKWGELDKKIMGMYVALPRYYDKMAVVIGTGIGGAEGDPTMGLPFFVNMFVKS